jgi:hypothetical protein
MGCTCDNCGKLIANIANVKGESSAKFHSIGFDCLETFLINNNILDQKGTEHYQQVVKKSVAKVKKIRETIKDFLKANPFIDAVELELQSYLPNYITFNYFSGGRQRWNDGTKIKEMDFDMLLASLQSISDKVTFTIKKS